MSARQHRDRRHSVAFRVTEDQWRALQAIAEKRTIAVAQLAKKIVFEMLGLHAPSGRARKGGQRASRASKRKSTVRSKIAG